MARCDGCNKEIELTEPVVMAAFQYRFCLDCVCITSRERDELVAA